MSRDADRAHLSRSGFWRRAAVEGGRWLYSVLGLVLFAVSVLALAGIVVVLDGPLWLIGVVVGLILLVGLAEGTYRVWRESEREIRKQRSADLADELLHRNCLVTAGGIQSFVYERQAARPTLPPEKVVARAEGTLSRAEEADFMWLEIGHQQDTKRQYEEQFAERVFEIVVELRQRGYIPESDLEWLNHPKDLEGIKRVGDRLWDIGRRVRPAHWKQADE
jgi:hypothetical protein